MKRGLLVWGTVVSLALVFVTAVYLSLITIKLYVIYQVYYVQLVVIVSKICWWNCVRGSCAWVRLLLRTGFVAGV